MPSNRMRPPLGRSTPEIMLNSVVLPAPFGPITLQISPDGHIEADIGNRLQAAKALAEIFDTEQGGHDSHRLRRL